jgi:hypothetical protein
MAEAALAQVRVQQPASQDSAFKVVITGKIDTRTLMEFAAIATDPRVARSGTPVLELDSPGGSVHAAMAIGVVARSGGFDTYVRRNTSCDSACVLILAAGVDRSAAGHVGLHRPRVRDGSPALHTARYEEAAADMRRYLAHMGVADDLVNVMLSAPAHGVRTLSPQELQALGLARRELMTASAGETSAEVPPHNRSAPEAAPIMQRAKAMRDGGDIRQRHRLRAIVARGPPPHLWSAASYDSRYDGRRIRPRHASPVTVPSPHRWARKAAPPLLLTAKRPRLRTAAALGR